LAFISIDNAVELMIKTFLSLPRRITGLKITRKEFDDIGESFPNLLDALERNATDKLDGIDLGEIEWYHRLRNQLYHQGNGLTVERDKVQVYAQLAQLLFKNLFGLSLLPVERGDQQALGEFMEGWVDLERRLHALASARGLAPYPRALLDGVRRLREENQLSEQDVLQFEFLRRLRNEVVHGQVDVKSSLDESTLRQLRDLLRKLPPPASTA
jgi:hypothetical protein